MTGVLNMWFLDNGTLAGTKEFLIDDHDHVMSQGQKIGLILGSSKCVIILANQQVIDAVRAMLPGA